MNQILLEVKPSLFGVDHRRNGLVAHGENFRLDAERETDGLRGLGEGRAFAEHGRTMNVRRQVAIAQVEPRRAAVYGQLIVRAERLVAKAPARLGIHHPGQRIGHDIEIGRDGQSVHHDVVAGIDDDGEFARIHCAAETDQELRRANPTRQRDDFHQ